MAITFPDSDHEPLELARGESLAIELDIENSPVLFGCRTGICGTCACATTGTSTSDWTGTTRSMTWGTGATFAWPRAA